MVKNKVVNSILSERDWYDYLLILYFGRGNPISCCINRAYRDFNRTLHGLVRLKDHDFLYKNATSYLKLRLRKLRIEGNKFDQLKFDKWHGSSCFGLIEKYQKFNYSYFTIGQAQKWINMTLKYIFTFGEDRIPGFYIIYPHCHTPIDRIVLDKIKKYNAPIISQNWSRLNDYDEYNTLQKWIRENFNQVALDAEFKIWKGDL